MDPELAAVFRAEAEEHLAVLTRGLLALEADPGPPGPEALAELFRAAHRLKGAARVVGAEDLEGAAHRMEDLLSGPREGRPLAPDQRSALSALLDGLENLVARAIAGGDPERPAPAPPAAPPMPPEAPAPAGPRPETGPPNRPGTAAGPVPGPPGGAAPAPPPLEILRVPAPRLDELLNLTGELLVIRQRIRGSAGAAADLAEALEEGARRVQASRVPPPKDPAAAEAEPGPADGVPGEARRLARSLVDQASRLETLLDALADAVRRTRLVPVARLFDQVPKWVRDLLRQTGKDAEVELAGGGLEVDKRILDGLKDPLLHLLRNAVDHGLEPGPDRVRAGKPARGRLRVEAAELGERIHVTVADDGRGVDLEAVRAALVAGGRLEPAQAAALGREALFRQLFLPGFSTRAQADALSGRGVGLDLVRTQVEALKGAVVLESEPGAGTRVQLRVPLSLATVRVLLARAQGLTLGLPAEAVQGCLHLGPDRRFPVEGRPSFLLEGATLRLAPLASLLGPPGRPQAGGSAPPAAEPWLVVVVRHLGERAGFRVDALLGEQEVLQKPLGRRLASLAQYRGAALLEDGSLCLVLNPAALLDRAAGAAPAQEAVPGPVPEPARTGRRVLLADDSLAIRVQLGRVLEAAGYQVSLAVDGLDAWARLRAQPFDALVSDVDMPGLDGLALVRRVRAEPALAGLPVVLVTALDGPEARRRGLEAGADAYLAKARFDQTELVETLGRLA